MRNEAADLVRRCEDHIGPVAHHSGAHEGRHIPCVRLSNMTAAQKYVSGRSRYWLKFKNPNAPAVKREAEEDWGKER
jgi:hypothetical protein